ncbi:protein rep [Okeania sp. SIO2B9]|uniref:protein rep n=1 Tax=Okeania sp. SIO2B9 TaxID=2607782 RepID=UPI00257C2A52|nr:protein rep [Okeania sp. SIO2B9]
MGTFNSQYPSSSFVGMPPFLGEIFPGDANFNKLQHSVRQSANLLQIAAENRKNQAEASKLQDWSDKLMGRKYNNGSCGSKLSFIKTSDGPKLIAANFCRVRCCPMCTSRRSAMWRAKAFRAYPELEKLNLRYLLLTLTVRNVPVSRLREFIDNTLSPASHEFMMSFKYKLGKLYRGYLRSFECTQTKHHIYNSHPHLHYMIAVEHDYFDKKYMEQSEFKELWKRSLKADYDPIVSIEAVDDFERSPLEVLKYELKPADYVSDWHWFPEYALQVSGVQRISLAGVFRKHFNFLNRDGSLISSDYDDDNRNFFKGKSGKKAKVYNFEWLEKGNNKQYCLRGA